MTRGVSIVRDSSVISDELFQIIEEQYEDIWRKTE
jgi:hypothetical protein